MGKDRAEAIGINSVQVQPKYLLQIDGDQAHPLVTVWPDGSIEYGEGYDPDTAARIFWEAVAKLAPHDASLAALK